MADTDDPALDYVQRNFPSTGDLGRVPESVINYSDYVAAKAQTKPDQTPPPPEKTQLSPQSTGNVPLSFSPPPKLTQYDAPHPQKDEYSSTFDVFKDPMVVLAGLSSLFTRRPLTAAMNYAAGAMKGFHEGQKDIFDQNKVKFDEAIKATVEQNRTELNKYNAAWDRRKEFNWQKVAPELYAQASANNDQLLMTAIQSGSWDLVEKILVGRETAQNRLQQAVDLADQKEQAREREVDRLKSDPGVIAQAKAIQNYEQPMPPLSRNNPRNQAINELVTQHSQESGEPYQTSGYGAKNKFVTGLGSTTPGSPGGQVNSAKIVVRHLATLDQLIDDLGTDSNTATFRRAAQRIQTEFGLSSAPTNFDAAVSLVAGEIIKLVEGAGGTGEDREHVRTAFDRANSTPLLHDAVDVAREVMSARVDSLSEQAKAAHAESEFNRYLPPGIQKLLEPRRSRGGNFDVEDFKKKAKAAGYSDAEISKFLVDKGH